MKKILASLSIVLLISSMNFLFAQKEVPVNTKINKITVFLSNAQIERSTTLNLPAGNSEIIITGLSQYMDVNSLRFSGKGDFIILSHQHQIKYPEPVDKKEEIPLNIQRQIKSLTDSIENITYDIQENQLRREVFQFEKNTLQSSKALTSTDTLPALRDGLAYYRTKMIEINNELLKIDRRAKNLQKQKTEMDARLIALRNYSSGFDSNKPVQLPESVLKLSVMADKAVSNAVIEFSYLTAGVTWEPFYDLKVEEVSKPVQLSLKANVTQNTGENWERVKLVFSTGRPTAYKRLPILNVWYLNYNMPRTAQTANVYMDAESTRGSAVTQKGSKEEISMDIAVQSHNFVQMNQNLLFAEYEVNIPYTINSDGKSQTISLMSTSLNATFKYLAIPKIDNEAFLTAYLEGWEKLSLVQGRANVIYNNSIISQTVINPAVVDTLIVSLGVDKRVNIERKKLSDKSRDRVIGNTRERTIHMEITIKNQNQTEIEMLLKDQIPISKLSDIKVTLDESKDAKYNENTGELEWNLKLRPNETRKVEFRYTIKFDSSKNLLTE